MAEAKPAQLFVEALDRVAYGLPFARLWLFDVIHGPEAQTPADEKRKADRERLEKAFPNLDFDETMAVADEDWYAQAKLTAPLTASGAAPPRSAASAYRPAPLDSSSGCKPRRGRLDLRSRPAGTRRRPLGRFAGHQRETEPTSRRDVDHP
jgi:hypothetical protein